MTTKKLFQATVLALGALAASATSAFAAPAPLDIDLLGRTPAGGEATAEIAAFDPRSERVFATDAESNQLDVFDFSDPTAPAALAEIDLGPYGDGPNSVVFSPRFGGFVAVAVEAAEVGVPGSVEVFDVDGDHLASFPAGPLPDMVTTARDDRYLLVANEGEPADDGSVDPEGSVTVIDLKRGLEKPVIRTAGFHGVPLLGPVRVFTPGSTVAQDLEPEYITSAGNRAWVSIQEANAIAILDIERARFEVVRSLGFKDLGVPGFGLDATDRDDAVTIQTHPNVLGMYQPDAVSAFTVRVPVRGHRGWLFGRHGKGKRHGHGGSGQRGRGHYGHGKGHGHGKDHGHGKGRHHGHRGPRFATRTFIATANEGDARDFDFFSEEERVDDLDLDPSVFPAGTQDDLALGRLNVTTTLGDADGDGLYEELYAYGGRSMSLLDARGRLVYDSGDQLEQLSASLDPANYNTDNEPSDIDNRSDNKGPEPEAVATGTVGGHTYAFLAAERSGMIYAFDLSSRPGEAEFAGWINTREDDLGPEGIVFVPARRSPTGEAMLLVTYEVSGTVAAYGLTR
jgi:hypothetical protein